MDDHVCRSSIEVLDALRAKTQSIVIDPSVLELALPSCQLGDEEVRRLAFALKTNRTLTSLNLAYNKIKESAQCIADLLKNNKSLNSLDLQGNDISPGRLAIMFSESLNNNATLSCLNIGTIEGTDQQNLCVLNTIQANIEAHLRKNKQIRSLMTQIHKHNQDFCNLQKHAEELQKNFELTGAKLSERENTCKILEEQLTVRIDAEKELKARHEYVNNQLRHQLDEQQEAFTKLKSKLVAYERDGASAQKNYADTDLDHFVAWLDDAQNQPKNIEEIESQMERLKKIEIASNSRNCRLIDRLQKVVLKYQGAANLNKNCTVSIERQSKKRKRSEEEKSTTDNSSSSESDELNEAEPKSRSVQSKDPKLATKRSHKRSKKSEIGWESHAVIKVKDQARKLKEIPEDVIDYFKNPESPKTFKHNGVTYNKQLSEFPKYGTDLPFNDKKRLQCIVCREKTAEYGNNTCPRAVMCAGCAVKSVWWPTPRFD